MYLASDYGRGVARPAVEAARAGDRDGVVVALAGEQDQRQRADRARLEAYARAAEPYLNALARVSAEERRLSSAHERVRTIAGTWLPATIALPEPLDDDAR